MVRDGFLCGPPLIKMGGIAELISVLVKTCIVIYGNIIICIVLANGERERVAESTG